MDFSETEGRATRTGGSRRRQKNKHDKDKGGDGDGKKRRELTSHLPLGVSVL